MLCVVTLSVFLPSFTSSSVVWAVPSIEDTATSASNRAPFFIATSGHVTYAASAFRRTGVTYVLSASRRTHPRKSIEPVAPNASFDRLIQVVILQWHV